MRNRLSLDETLREALGLDNVYYQPPTSIKMKYPAIIYHKSNIHSAFANDDVYSKKEQYTITVVDYKVNSEIDERVSKIKRIRYNRQYIADGLYHFVYTISI